jgi:NDP-sugar pyrophosphorylase family protein
MMKAMILAAGFGTRLHPLTAERPKALMPIANKPVIDWVIDYLKKHGVDSIVVNAHHHSDQIVRYLKHYQESELKIEVRIEKDILGTGGGIKNTEDFWDERPFVVINADTLTDIDLGNVYHHHTETRRIATLVLHDCAPYNQIRIDQNACLRNIADQPSKGRFAFTGIHIIDPLLLDYLKKDAFSNIIDTYRDLIKSESVIGAHICDGHYWCDIGTVGSYMQANKDYLKGGRMVTGPHCKIHPSARVLGWAAIGKGCVVEENAIISNSILWDEVIVRRGVKVVESVVTTMKEVTCRLEGKIY